MEIRKLRREIGNLDRENESSEGQNRVVRLPTAEETNQYGISILERKIDVYRGLEDEKEMLQMKIFMVKLREKRMRP